MYIENSTATGKEEIKHTHNISIKLSFFYGVTAGCEKIPQDSKKVSAFGLSNNNNNW